MTRVAAAAYGPPDEVLSVTSAPPPPPPARGQLLLRVAAVSLSPTDYRQLSGDTDGMKPIPGGAFPYTPGGDMCGTVVAVHNDDAGPGAAFAVGDTVVATWEIAGGGGLAEYCLVDAVRAAVKPPSLSNVDGAALANSAGHALLAVRAARVAAGDRVLVLGGGGGVGTALVQLARDAGAGHVAATAADAKRLAALGVDDPIPYGERDWWAVPPGTPPYDVVFDCAVGDDAWRRVAASPAVLKAARDGGRFVAIHHAAHIVCHGWGDVLRFLGPLVGRAVGSFFRRSAPRYRVFLGTITGGVLREVLAAAAAGKLRAVIDPAGPFPMTTEGVRAAFNLHASRHAQGKVVIRVAEEATGGAGSDDL